MTTTTTTTSTTATVTTTTAVLNPELELVIAEFNDVKAAIKELEATKLRIETELREALGDCEAGTINGIERVRIQRRVTSKIDRAALEAAWPEAFEATLVQTPYTVLSAK